MVEGLFVNRKLERVSFLKELESGRILNEKGICAKAPVSFLPFLVKHGRGGGATPAAPGLVARGAMAATGWGKREREVRGVDSRP